MAHVSSTPLWTGSDPGELLWTGSNPGKLLWTGSNPGKLLWTGSDPGKLLWTGSDTGKLLWTGSDPGKLLWTGSDAGELVPHHHHPSSFSSAPGLFGLNFFLSFLNSRRAKDTVNYCVLINNVSISTCLLYTSDAADES